MSLMQITLVEEFGGLEVFHQPARNNGWVPLYTQAESKMKANQAMSTGELIF